MCVLVGAGSWPVTRAIACTRRKVHFDHHAIAFSPQPHWAARPGLPTRVWVGTDGGLAKSEDGGATWTPMNAGLVTNLLRGIDIGRGACGAAMKDLLVGRIDDVEHAARVRVLPFAVDKQLRLT